MHTLVEMSAVGPHGTHVPAFLAKLWRMVDEPSSDDLIHWSDGGNSFLIRNQAKFSSDLLPLYYKHNNMASFVRQLNMYGFHKVVSVEQGGLKMDKDEMEFAHPFFLRGQEPSLELIKRKIPSSKHDETRGRSDNLQKVLMDVRQMKGRQENMDTKLLTMKKENEALWRELATLRAKHAKQTQIVSKLLQFLVGMMSSQTRRIGFKRRLPLMLNGTEGASSNKVSRIEGESAPSGPTIHDVTEIFEAEDSADDQEGCDNITGISGSGSDGDTQPTQPIMNSPLTGSTNSQDFGNQFGTILGLSSNLEPNRAFSGSSTSSGASQSDRNSSRALAPQYHPKQMNNNVTEDLDGHLDEMQLGIESLKDMLTNDEYKMDQATLFGVSGTLQFSNSLGEQLFDATDLGDLGLSKELQQDQTGENVGLPNLGGQELVAYNPSLFELTESGSQFFDDSSSHLFLDDELESMLTTDRENLLKAQQDTAAATTRTVAGTSTLVATTNISGAGKRKRK